MSEETCYHENFAVQVDIARIEDEEKPFSLPKHFFADIKIECADCGLPFSFIGVPSGCSPLQPMVSPTGVELRAPIQPGEMKPTQKSVFVVPQ